MQKFGQGGICNNRLQIGQIQISSYAAELLKEMKDGDFQILDGVFAFD